MILTIGTQVEHPEFGLGTVVEALGNKAVVNFFGELIDVEAKDLKPHCAYEAPVKINEVHSHAEKIAFRQAYEALNLGVVPPNKKTLVDLTIRGEEIRARVLRWIEEASQKGLCKVVLGNYGTGKTHFMRIVRAIFLQAGWIVSYIEFDPKAADPAKPHLVYRSLMANLSLPPREDGSIADGFFGLIREIRRKWDEVRDRPLLKASPWFTNGLETLLYFPHNESDQDYLDACQWLAGQPVDIRVIRKLASHMGKSGKSIPIMPKIKETADIYVFHLAVLHEISQALGYQGLVIIMDEAEHVRGYNVRRKERANNFFDLLARAAHPSVIGDSHPTQNDHGHAVPPYWRKGPLFALFIGLTPGNIFADLTLPLREACVFLFSEDDIVTLSNPTPIEYESWCNKFLSTFYEFYPETTALLTSESNRRGIARVLRKQFEATRENERILRIWIKLATLVPSVLLARNTGSLEELKNIIAKAAKEATGDVFPWEF